MAPPKAAPLYAQLSKQRAANRNSRRLAPRSPGLAEILPADGGIWPLKMSAKWRTTPTIMFNPSFPHPTYLPREPERSWSVSGTLLTLLQQVMALIVVSVLSLPLWPIYLVFRVFWERPPIVPSFARTLRCVRALLTEWSPQGPSFVMRLSLFLELVRQEVGNGFMGFAWIVDEIAWGRDLNRVKIIEPIFELSAARSGSTQLAHYLEDDPQLCAPNSLQIAFPFVWLWRIAPHFERFLPADWQEKLIQAKLPKEMHERHEANPLRTDTFEVLFLATFQLVGIFNCISARALMDEFRVDELTERNRDVWEYDFLRFVDGIGRKTLMEAHKDPEGPPRRLLLKGHFLLVAEHLAHRYPDARFLTMLRVPEKRLQSGINFLRCQPTIAPCPPVPWAWLVEYACTTEVNYCEKEIAWFQRPQGPRRCIIPFDDYVRDLEGTMRKVYRECLDQELPAHIPRTHAPRVRTNYSVDRSLEQLSIDEAALKKRLERYRQWCKTGAPV